MRPCVQVATPLNVCTVLANIDFHSSFSVSFSSVLNLEYIFKVLLGSDFWYPIVFTFSIRLCSS